MRKQKLKMGMIGGGPGSFIGEIHRMAARLDGETELVCGVFSSTPETSEQAGRNLHLPASRVYGSYQELIEQEKVLHPAERMDFVSIVHRTTCTLSLPAWPWKMAFMLCLTSP